MIRRYVACMPPGVAITAGLLLLMQSLIDLGSPATGPTGREHPVAWRSLERPAPPPRAPQEALPRRIVAPVALPSNHVRVPATEHRDPGTARRIIPGAPLPHMGTGTVSPWRDTPLVSLVRVEPRYPVSAMRDGREGYVIVEFDVLADGTTGNARVLESSDAVFERAALGAAAKFLYTPRVVDGVPSPTTGVRTMFRFELERASR